jgi:Ser/Thr protein kinase RdoA (MazF antagonist)
MSDLEAAAAHVLGHYPAPLTSGVRRFLGNHGGFSGARLWRIESSADPLCLRAWPAETAEQQLILVHHAMRSARGAGLAFVPTVLATNADRTFVEYQGRLWDLTSWLPGRADFPEAPSPQRLAAACAALAQLHVAWSHAFSRSGMCPAVQRRLDRVSEWVSLLASGWLPDFDRESLDPVRPWAQYAWHALQGQIERIPTRLAPWAERRLPLQLSLCDIWHAHVLYQGDTVSGIIDYGSVKIDHVSVDLARLLGSLVGSDAEQRTLGFNAYRTVRPLTDEEEQLAIVLDDTGTLLSAANWLRWLYHDRDRRFDDRQAVARRLAELVGRL